MTGLEIYAVIKFWGPILTLSGVVIRIGASIRRSYLNTKKEVQTWASTLLDNHATHVQASLQRMETGQDQLVKSQDRTNELLAALVAKQ